MTKHQGLRAWGRYAHLTNELNTKRLLDLCKSKRIVRILIIQVDLGAKL